MLHGASPNQAVHTPKTAEHSPRTAVDATATINIATLQSIYVCFIRTEVATRPHQLARCDNRVRIGQRVEGRDDAVSMCLEAIIDC